MISDIFDRMCCVINPNGVKQGVWDSWNITVIVSVGIQPDVCLDCSVRSDCRVPDEHCEARLLGQCSPCSDICAPQYTDSRSECQRWCPEHSNLSQRDTASTSGLLPTAPLVSRNDGQVTVDVAPSVTSARIITTCDDTLALSSGVVVTLVCLSLVLLASLAAHVYLLGTGRRRRYDVVIQREQDLQITGNFKPELQWRLNQDASDSLPGVYEGVTFKQILCVFKMSYRRRLR